MSAEDGIASEHQHVREAIDLEVGFRVDGHLVTRVATGPSSLLTVYRIQLNDKHDGFIYVSATLQERSSAGFHDAFSANVRAALADDTTVKHYLPGNGPVIRKEPHA